jgi:NADH-quinone oxidoreductase subunit N
VSLVVIGVLTSAIAASFYVRVIVVMFFRDAGEVDSGNERYGSAGAGEVAFARRPVTYAVVGIAVVVTILLGIVPQPLLDLATAAAAFAG